ncbi:MAG TPA: DUF1365 domain-containing protein [Kofleriaceae bacterium]
MSFASALYRGELVHARHDAVAKRAFRYAVYVAALDLAELPALDRELRLFSHRKRNVFSFDDRDYAVTLAPSTRHATATIAATPAAPSAANGPELLDGLAALREANGLPTPATTRLVTNLRVLGYTFNPVSFFLDYNAQGTLTSAIAEVNNTYGGRFRYVLGPAQRLPATSATRIGFRHVRELFVSPFLHGPATYDFYFDAPLDHDQLAIEMHVQRGVVTNGAVPERLFTARLTGTRAPLSDRVLVAAALRYPLMSAQVIGLIHFEALKMRLAGAPYRRPDRDHRPLVERPHEDRP